jgi:hypothetical protein
MIENHQSIQSLHSILSAYGDIIELDYKFELDTISQLESIEQWIDTHGNKQAINLNGPSEDLELSHDRDGDKKHAFGQTANENLNKCPSIINFFNKFDNLARCRAVKLNSGSFFRPHRDAWRFNEQFRIFIPLNGTDDTDWMFFLDDNLIKFKPGVPYVLNTRKTHGSFTFSDNIYHIIMSLPLTESNLKAVMKMLPMTKEY